MGATCNWTLLGKVTCWGNLDTAWTGFLLDAANLDAAWTARLLVRVTLMLLRPGGRFLV